MLIPAFFLFWRPCVPPLFSQSWGLTVILKYPYFIHCDGIAEEVSFCSMSVQKVETNLFLPHLVIGKDSLAQS
jgi:hypothetical protein